MIHNYTGKRPPTEPATKSWDQKRRTGARRYRRQVVKEEMMGEEKKERLRGAETDVYGGKTKLSWEQKVREEGRSVRRGCKGV